MYIYMQHVLCFQIIKRKVDLKLKVKPCMHGTIIVLCDMQRNMIFKPLHSVFDFANVYIHQKACMYIHIIEIGHQMASHTNWGRGLNGYHCLLDQQV